MLHRSEKAPNSPGYGAPRVLPGALASHEGSDLVFHGDHLGGPVFDVLRPGRHKRLVRLLQALDAVIPPAI